MIFRNIFIICIYMNDTKRYKSNLIQNRSSFKPYTRRMIELADNYGGDRLIFCNTRNFNAFFNFLMQQRILSFERLNDLFTDIYSEENELIGFCLSRLVYTFIQEFNRTNARISENIVLNRLLEENNIERVNYRTTDLGNSNVYFEEFTIYPNNTPAVMIFYLIIPEGNGFKIKIVFSIRGTQTLDDIKSLMKPQKKDTYLFNTAEILKIDENINRQKRSGKKIFASNNLGNPMIHKGFRGYFRKIDKILLRKTLKFINIFTKKYKNYLGSEFCFIGHSLGGVLSVLNSLNSLISGYNTYIYSYCSPRIGGEKFNYFIYSQLLRNPYSKYFSFYNKDDTVNNLPPKQFGYLNLSEFLSENGLSLMNYEEFDKQENNVRILEFFLKKNLQSALGIYYKKVLHSLFVYKVPGSNNKMPKYFVLHS